MKMTITIVQTTIELDFGDENDAPVKEPKSPPSFLELLRRQAERSLYTEPKEETVYGPFLSQ